MKNWMRIALWSAFGLGIAALMISISSIQANRTLEEPDIVVVKSGENPFLTDIELLQLLERKGLYQEGMTRKELNVAEIEKMISEISQVKKVKVYTEIGSIWKIEVELRNPIARIFNTSGESFYLDEDGDIVSTTPTHTARVIVVTGAINDRKDGHSVAEIINNDSLKSILKLDDIYRISNYVCYDPFFRSMIGQIHLEKNGDFILTAVVGDQKVVFGRAETDQEVKEKFSKLKIFYDEAMPSVGWHTYTEISLKYEEQIVCKIKPIAE
ncbi:MAG: cell division protein FtsQ [Flavobacteriaceae bacterium]|jgi:cell division protein FtsQ